MPIFDCLTLISLHINILVNIYFKLYQMKEIWQAQLLMLEIEWCNITQFNVIVINPCVDFVSDWKNSSLCVSDGNPR